MKDKDGTVHHPSNYKNCSICLDLWIKRENKKAVTKQDFESKNPTQSEVFKSLRCL